MNWIVFLYVLAEIETGNGFENKPDVVTKYQITQAVVDRYNDYNDTNLTLKRIAAGEISPEFFVVNVLQNDAIEFHKAHRRKPTHMEYAVFWRDGYPMPDAGKRHLLYAERLLNLYWNEMYKRDLVSR